MIRNFNVPKIKQMKQKGDKIVVLTAYDYLTAKLIDSCGIEMILVGDSLGMVFQGELTTIGVTLEQMIYHCKIVSKAAKDSVIIGDMPFGTFQTKSSALKNSSKVMKEGGVQAIKMEGGSWLAPTIKKLIKIGIPVVGHLGLTPQSIYKFGTYGVRAKKEDEAIQLKKDAQTLQDAGVFALVLEKIPAALAKEVTEELEIPTIGIGAGNYCNGQVLVTQDLLGLFDEFHPKFVRRYAEIGKDIQRAISSFKGDVKNGTFPSQKESY